MKLTPKFKRSIKVKAIKDKKFRRSIKSEFDKIHEEIAEIHTESQEELERNKKFANEAMAKIREQMRMK